MEKSDFFFNIIIIMNNAKHVRFDDNVQVFYQIYSNKEINKSLCFKIKRFFGIKPREYYI
jgi:hypothetical protein